MCPLEHQNEPADTSHRTRLLDLSHGLPVVLDESPAVLLFNPLTQASLHPPAFDVRDDALPSTLATDWTQLPGDLLQSISKKLTVYHDYIRFRAVCPQWRSSVPRDSRHLPPQIPWLMLPLSESHLQSHRSFYDLSTGKTHHLELPEASGPELRIDSSNGWLVIFDNSSAILLLNPLTLAKFHLPPLSSFPSVASLDCSKVDNEYAIREASGKIYHRSLRAMRDFFIKKIVLSSGSVNKDSFIAVAILDKTGELAYCKNGDQSWTSMDDVGLSCCDVTYYKEKFYAVDPDGSIAVCDVNGESPSVSVIRISFSQDFRYILHMVYLVHSGDELLLVVRQVDYDVPLQGPFVFFFRTSFFEVYRMNWSGLRWGRVKNLGNRLLFARENSSVSLSAADVGRCLPFPSYISPNDSRYLSPNDYYGQCLKNSIYFTDDNRVRCYDTNDSFGPPQYEGIRRDNDGTFDWDRGIYTLRGRRIISLPFRTRDPHALWVTPTP